MREAFDDNLSSDLIITIAQHVGQRTTVALALCDRIPTSDVTQDLSTQERLLLLSTKDLLREYDRRMKMRPEQMSAAMHQALREHFK